MASAPIGLVSKRKGDKIKKIEKIEKLNFVTFISGPKLDLLFVFIVQSVKPHGLYLIMHQT